MAARRARISVIMASATGFLHGTTITLDEPVPPLDGQRVRVVVEPADEEMVLSAEENVRLLREWAEHGAQGPLELEEAQAR
jgi:hypothetical protein